MLLTCLKAWVISFGLYLLLDFIDRPLRNIFDLLPLFAAFVEYIATVFIRVVDYKTFKVLKCHNTVF